MKENGFRLPNAADIGGQDALVRVWHNVPDLLLSLDETKRKAVGAHYRARGHHHLTAGNQVLLPVADASEADDLLPLTAWFGRNLSVEFAIVSDDPGYLPLPKTTTIVDFPYYANEQFEATDYWGPHTQHVQELKNKRTFFEGIQSLLPTLEKIAAERGWNSPLTLPYEIGAGRRKTLAVIRAKEEAIEAMYQEATVAALREESFEKAAALANYCPGVLFRLTSGDGGYGTGSLEKTFDGYVVTTESSQITFKTRGQAYEFLNTILEDEEYIVTRKVDTVDSPSIGVYFADGHFVPMPLTIQFMNGVGCVGGGSKNTTSEAENQFLDSLEPGLQEVATLLTAYFTDGGVRHGHIGFDFIVGSQKEAALANIIAKNPQLKEKYGAEPSVVSVVESNPRFTSLSLTVQPLIKYEHALRTKHNGHITGADLLRWYGQADKDGVSGGFAVWDYVDVPETITSTQELVNFIDRFNESYQQSGIVMIPRIPLRVKENRQVTSVAVGLLPTDDREVHNLFRTLVQAVTHSGNISSLGVQ